MRRLTWVFAVLAVTGTGLFACSSSTSTTTPGSLPFTVAESLLVVFPADPTIGYALLSSATGTCNALQSGIDVVGSPQLGNVDYAFFLLGVLDGTGAALPLTGGTYTIVDPNTGSFTPPGLLSNVGVVEAVAGCGAQVAYAGAGTATISPFVTTDGGVSPFSFAAAFNATEISGSYSLATCPVITGIDAGVCCDMPDAGGACVLE